MSTMIQNIWSLGTLALNSRTLELNIQIFLNNSTLRADFAEKWAFGFQDPASPWMYAIIDLHDRIMFYLIILLIVVVWFLVSATLNTNPINFHHGNLIELIWTLTPAGILWAIGLPSLKLLYMIDEILDAEITIKAIGNQWYWSYEYSDYVDSLDKSIAFDSFMVSDDSLEEGDLRQLAVDNYLVLPINTSIRLLVTSNDVIHSFAIPSLALKLDAIPGRLNSTGILITRPSTFYGQCSELCGVLHGFMPIGIHGVDLPSYLNFLRSMD
nr:cytochrome oxidase subunit II [Synchytrium endobioticum]